MKNYKFLDSVWLSHVESKINDLADEGWVVKSFTIVAEGENNDDKNAYVLLEMDENEVAGDTLSDIKGELQDVNEKLSEIYQRLRSTGNKGFDEILDYLKSIESSLSGIYDNTAG